MARAALKVPTSQAFVFHLLSGSGGGLSQKRGQSGGRYLECSEFREVYQYVNNLGTGRCPAWISLDDPPSMVFKFVRRPLVWMLFCLP